MTTIAYVLMCCPCLPLSLYCLPIGPGATISNINTICLVNSFSYSMQVSLTCKYETIIMLR